ncbi:MAG: hypothetical protein WA970_24800 [Gammaproteobacteria bacterium]|jgi:hypothetical protein
MNDARACKGENCGYIKYGCWRYVKAKAARQDYLQPANPGLACESLWPLTDVTVHMMCAEGQNLTDQLRTASACLTRDLAAVPSKQVLPASC